MPRAALPPLRPALAALLDARGEPWPIRLRRADELAARVLAHPAHTHRNKVAYVFTELTKAPRKRKEARQMSGKIIEETPEETAAHEQAKAAATNGHASPEQQEFVAAKATRARREAAAREAWLESEGFAALITQAEARLAEVPRLIEEHRQAQAASADLDHFIALAAELPEARPLQRFRREAEALKKTIQARPRLLDTAEALGALVGRVRAVDLGAPNGAARNSNAARALREQFAQLSVPAPPPGYPARCREDVRALLAEARRARTGG